MWRVACQHQAGDDRQSGRSPDAPREKTCSWRLITCRVKQMKPRIKIATSSENDFSSGKAHGNPSPYLVHRLPTSVGLAPAVRCHFGFPTLLFFLKVLEIFAEYLLLSQTSRALVNKPYHPLDAIISPNLPIWSEPLPLQTLSVQTPARHIKVWPPSTSL